MNGFESINARIIVKIVSNELGLVYAKNISKFIEFMKPTVVLYYTGNDRYSGKNGQGFSFHYSGRFH